MFLLFQKTKNRLNRPRARGFDFSVLSSSDSVTSGDGGRVQQALS